MKKSNRCICLILVLVLIIVLSACGITDNKAVNDTAAKEPVTVKKLLMQLRMLQS